MLLALLALLGPPQQAAVWDNYDFVPGSKVLFFTDFSEDRVGNFARRLKYRSGPAEVVERDGVKVLRATATPNPPRPTPPPRAEPRTAGWRW